MSEEVELGFRDWVSRVNERLTLILLNIKEKRDLTEADRDVLESFLGIYREGIMPFYQNKLKLDVQNITETGLFDTSTSDTGNGIQFDYTLSNDKNIEK